MNECECASQEFWGFMFSFRVFFFFFLMTHKKRAGILFHPTPSPCVGHYSGKSAASGFTLHFHHPTKEKISVAQVGISNGTNPCGF
jgi:hypothetical protein